MQFLAAILILFSNCILIQSSLAIHIDKYNNSSSKESANNLVFGLTSGNAGELFQLTNRTATDDSAVKSSAEYSKLGSAISEGPNDKRKDENISHNAEEDELRVGCDVGKCLQGSPPARASGSFIMGLLMSQLVNATLLGQVLSGYKGAPGISAPCEKSLDYLQQTLPLGDDTAVRLVDASAKLPTGLLQGSIIYLGSYDECVAILGQADTGSSPFQGQYCSVNVKLNIPTNDIKMGDGSTKPLNALQGIQWDLCVPSLCSALDVQAALSNSPLLKLFSQNVSTSVQRCETRPKLSLNSGQKVALSIFSVLGAIVLIGTLLDIAKQLYQNFSSRLPVGFVTSSPVATVIEWLNGNSKTLGAFMSFSLLTNYTKLMNTATGKDSLTAVNGIRFLSMSWVILGHCYYYVNISLVGNLSVARTLGDDFAFQAVLNATVSVDSFFFLSGLLVSYIAIGELQKKGKINWALFYFHRLWRLTPAYALVIVLVLLWPLIGSGPTWTASHATFGDSCYRNWWTNLLYVSNLVRTKEMCIGHSWFLANDMQFYFVSPVILIAMHKYPPVGLGLCALVTLISILTTSILGAVRHFPPTTLFFTSGFDSIAFMTDVYITPWCRWAPYGVGLAVGYFLAKKRDIVIPLKVQLPCWCLAIACNMSVLYGTYSWNTGNPHSNGTNAFYLGTHRTAWALGVAWVTYACATGHGGIVNRILSWKLFVPLGRLTYMAYLLHPIVQLCFTGMLRERLMYTHYLWVVLFLGFLSLSYGVAIAATLCFETPFLGLEKVFLGKLLRKKDSPQQEQQVNTEYSEFQNTNKEAE